MKVRELLSSPEKWTKRAFARSENNIRVHSLSERAVCWCLMGGIVKCYNDPIEKQLVINKVCAVIFPKANSIAEWNDASERTFKEVKQLVEELGI